MTTKYIKAAVISAVKPIIENAYFEQHYRPPTARVDGFFDYLQLCNVRHVAAQHLRSALSDGVVVGCLLGRKCQLKFGPGGVVFWCKVTIFA